MDKIKHKSHIEAIEEILGIYPILKDFLINERKVGYEDHSQYIRWINNQKILLEECLRKLKENYSYASIFPVIREIYENFWFINLAMNGTKHYKYFKAKKGHDINKIYKKWKNDLETAHKNGDLNDILEIHIGGRIRITYKGNRMNVDGKPTNEFIPDYYFLLENYDPIEAYVGKEKRIIEKYLTPPHLFHRFILPNKNLNRDYFEFQHGIIPHLLLNNLITKKQRQRIIIHYNFLSLLAHPNQIAFREAENNFNFTGNKNENLYMDRLVLLYIGNLTKMLLDSFFKFLIRQEQEKKISSPNKNKLKEINDKIKKFEDCTNYFWFIYNKPSTFYKYDYAINKIWRKHIIQKNIKKMTLPEINDNDVPYYNNPLESLKRMNQGWTNGLLGEYKPELKWE